MLSCVINVLYSFYQTIQSLNYLLVSHELLFGPLVYSHPDIVRLHKPEILSLPVPFLFRRGDNLKIKLVDQYGNQF